MSQKTCSDILHVIRMARQLDLIMVLFCRSTNELNSIYKKPVILQFLISIFSICTTTFLIASDLHSELMFGLVSYLSSLLVQIFLYCWHGHMIHTNVSKL